MGTGAVDSPELRKLFGSNQPGQLPKFLLASFGTGGSILQFFYPSLANFSRR